ncbi:MAG: ribonuclease P protein component [Bacilli bacterium]
MKKVNIVKENKDFNRIINERKSIKNTYFVVYKSFNNKEIYRIGISVGVKVGNAVIRNKLKRQVRNIIDLYKKDYEKGIDYIIMVRKSCLNTDFQILKEALWQLLDWRKNEEKK